MVPDTDIGGLLIEWDSIGDAEYVADALAYDMVIVFREVLKLLDKVEAGKDAYMEILGQ